jgi:hypothetical protein
VFSENVKMENIPENLSTDRRMYFPSEETERKKAMHETKNCM